MSRRIKTRPTTIHFSMVNRMFLDSLSERERRSITAIMDMDIDRMRLTAESGACLSERPHVVQ